MTYLISYIAVTILFVACILAAMTSFGVSLSLEIKDWWSRHHPAGSQRLLPH